MPTSELFMRTIKRIWIGTWEAGLFYYEPEKKIHPNPRKQLTAFGCAVFYEEPDGKLWIGSRNGIYSFSNEKLVCEQRINEQLEDLIIHGIHRDSQGKLWVGTFGKGIFIFSPQGKLLKTNRKVTGSPLTQ